MLAQLTTYFLRFHQVHIPSIGTVRMVQQPASLDVASKLIHLPQATLRFNEDGWLTRHQLWYFCTLLHTDETATRQALQDAGLDLRRAVEQGPFVWNAIGIFTYQNQALHFEPAQQPQLLQSVTAERVLRTGVQHSVLVGDQVVLSDGQTETTETRVEEKQRDWRMVAGWTAVILSLFFILFYLYQHQHQFSPKATGLHQDVAAPPPPATYQQ